MPEKLGFTFLGETPDAVTAPGEVGVDCAWAVDRSTWRRAREAAPGRRVGSG